LLSSFQGSDRKFQDGAVYSVQTSLGDAGVDQKVDLIYKLVKESDYHPIVRDSAEEIIRNIPPQKEYQQVKAVYDFIHEYTDYQRDIASTEMFQASWRVLEKIQKGLRPRLDCDDMTILGMSILRSIGYETRAGVSSTTSIPERDFNHIWFQVYLATKDEWIVFDATKKTRPLGQTPEFKRVKIYKEVE
jgi:transglutaminase-like putative cysteine protease